MKQLNNNHSNNAVKVLSFRSLMLYLFVIICVQKILAIIVLLYMYLCLSHVYFNNNNYNEREIKIIKNKICMQKKNTTTN